MPRPSAFLAILSGLLLALAGSVAYAETAVPADAVAEPAAVEPAEVPTSAVVDDPSVPTAVLPAPAAAPVPEAHEETEAAKPMPFVGLWQSQRPAPPMWLDIKPNGQAYRCYVEDAGEGDTDVYASNGTLADDRITWKILWGKERVTLNGESLVLKGKNGAVFYAKTKDPLPPACNGSDQAGTAERGTRSFNR